MLHWGVSIALNGCSTRCGWLPWGVWSAFTGVQNTEGRWLHWEVCCALTSCTIQGGDGDIEVSGVLYLRFIIQGWDGYIEELECYNWCAEDKLEMLNLWNLVWFNWGAEVMVKMITLRCLCCFNWGAEENVELVTLSWRALKWFRKQGMDDYIEDSVVF